MKLTTNIRKKFRVTNKLKRVASKIKTYRKIEPYKGKGIREKGQHVLKKEGKKK